MRDYLHIWLALLGFTIAAVTLVWTGFNWVLWMLAMYMVFMAFFHGATFIKTSHMWLCSYRFKEGDGRTFISCDTGKLSKDLVEKIDKYLKDNNPELGNIFVYNIQYLGKAPQEEAPN